MEILKLLRNTARINWWSGFLTANFLILFFQDLVGPEVYAGMIVAGAGWVATPVWIWPVAIVLLNAFIIWFTNQVIPVRKKKDEEPEEDQVPPPEAPV